MLKSWAEFFFIVVLVIGFLISVRMGSAVMSYFTITLCGMMAGRIAYEQKNKIKMPYYIIMIGFLIGYLLGSFYGHTIVIVILFLLGAILSYNLHDKHIIKSKLF